jgi:hypothetical protein
MTGKKKLCLKERSVSQRKFDKGTQADVFRFGDCLTTNYGFRYECGKKHASSHNPRKQN